MNKLEQGRVWVVIPAYNVAKYILQVIESVVRFVPLDHIIVVDDGSSDNSGALASSTGVKVITHPKNLGKGEALKDGYSAAILGNAEWIVSLDGDMQHDPAILPDFFTQAAETVASMLIGRRRFSGTQMPMDRRFSNWTSSALLSLVVGQRLFDIQCGYRMVKADIIKDIECSASRYDYEIELLLRVIRKGGKIGWVEIPTRYAGESSSIHRIRDTLRFLKRAGYYLTGKI